MNRDTELTVFLLKYLLDAHVFHSKEEMAQVFGISKRQIQRVMNNPERLKGGSIALSKILNYFGIHGISFDPVLMQYLELPTSSPAQGKGIAYKQISFLNEELISPEGLEALGYCREFIGLMSSYACPRCKTWCNPWNAETSLSLQSCIVAQTAKALLHSIEQEYTEKV